MTAAFGVGVDRDRLAAVCRRYGIATLSVFGSVARGAARRRQRRRPALRAPARSPARMGDRRSRRRAVGDLRAAGGLVARVALHPLLADTVLGEARPVYAA